MYNNAAIVHENIEPIIEQLRLLCYKYKIPFFFATPLKDEKSGKTSYYTSMLTGIEEDIHLNQNYIPQLALVVNGMKTVVTPTKEEDFEAGTD